MDKKKPITGRVKIRDQIRGNKQDSSFGDLANDPEFINDILLVGNEIAEEYDRVFKDGVFAEKEDFWMEYSEFEYECYRYAVNKKNKDIA